MKTSFLEMAHLEHAGILHLSVDEYHELDAFSQSTAKVVLERSPAHARAGYRKKPTKDMQRGDIIHKLVLGKGKEFEVIHADSFRTKDAQAKRDAAIARGVVPVLHDDFESYNLAAESIRVQLADRGVVLDGVSEQAVTWVEETECGPIRCKGMLDHVWLDIGIALDLKITHDASPRAVERTAENFGYGIQHAAYTSALAKILPALAGKVGMAYAFCEPEEPYALNLTEADGDFAELGKRRWNRACAIWARCLRDDTWPAYGPNTNPLTAPSWALYREGSANDER